MDKFEYIKNKWENTPEKREKISKEDIDEKFNEYIDKIKNNKLKLEEYTNLKSKQEDYFCNFIERKSSIYYGSAKPGNSANYGIARVNNSEKECYYVSKNLINENPKIEDESKDCLKNKNKDKDTDNNEEEKQKKQKSFIVTSNKKEVENIFKEKILPLLKEIVKYEIKEYKDIETIETKIENNEIIPAKQFLTKIFVIL